MTCQRLHTNLAPDHRCYHLSARPGEPCCHEQYQNYLRGLYKTKEKSQRLGHTPEPHLWGDWGAVASGDVGVLAKVLSFIHQTCTKYPLLPRAEHS